MTSPELVRSVTSTLHASPHEIFALLADPGRHPEIDGSGTVRAVKASSSPLTKGSTFDMHMKRGFAYATRSTVVELETDHVIAWQTRPITFPLALFIGGRIWRYELRPESGGTRVTATWDLRPERNRWLVRPLAGDPAGDMRRTLDRIDTISA